MRKIFASLIIIVGSITIGAIYLYLFYVYPVEKQVSTSAKPAIRSVLITYYLSEITGEYWTDEMFTRWESVSGMPTEARVDFLREVLLHCKLESSRALEFSEIAKSDTVALRSNLMLLRNSNRFKSLSLDQRETVTYWINTLKLL